LRIAKVQIEDVATPVLSLVVDGAHYDVAALEEIWPIDRDFGGVDFHTRVVAARCAGLDDLDARLHSGSRPTEARLLPGDFLPLPPCDPGRCAFLRVNEHGGEPKLSRGDSRAFFGDGQPVPVIQAGELLVAAGLAIVLADDLWRASARQAERAILGYTAILQWLGGDKPCSVGPVLLPRRKARDLASLVLSLEHSDRRECGGELGSWPFAPAEQVAFVSQRARLCAGDVIALTPTCLRPVAFGDRVRLEVPRVLRLDGWATVAPAPPNWRL
jgi:hypothetical protein